MNILNQQLALAQQRHAAGRLAEAEALYRAVLAEAPQHPHALHLLGVLAHQRGQHSEARTLIEQALAAHGPHPVFYSNLATVCLALGLLEQAEAHCRTALRLKPDLADAHTNLAAILERQGQRAAAENARRQALYHQSLPPDNRAQLEEAVRREPQNAGAQLELGTALLARGQAEQALAPLREAVRLKPDFVAAHHNLGSALTAVNQLDEAMACFRMALRLEPRNSAVRQNLAATLVFQGRTAEALAELEEALRLDPEQAHVIFMLSKVAVGGHYRFADEEVRRIAALAERGSVPMVDRSQLHLALALWFDQTGATDAAFEHALRGKALCAEVERAQGVAYDPALHERYADRLIATFTPAYFERVRSLGVSSDLPIFVVGMMRSGTTLAEQILASHPQVYGAGELADMGLLAGSLPRRLGAMDDYPECVARLDARTVNEVAAAYLQVLQKHAVSGRHVSPARVVDKMPLNFLGLGLIATLFPRARIVHCRRDPLDTCLSCFLRNFSTSFAFNYDLAHLGAYYRQYERLMAHWRAVLPVPIFELPYEDMTADPETLSRRLVAFCGLDWDDRCRRFHETDRPVRTASMLQVRQPIYRGAVGRWRRYEKHLQPLIEALGRDAHAG